MKMSGGNCTLIANSMFADGTKMIVASRSDKIVRFGTTQVKFLTPEEYWYFIKVRTFGSTDTQETRPPGIGVNGHGLGS